MKNKIMESIKLSHTGICNLGGDTSEDCRGCVYKSDYENVDGICTMRTRRDNMEKEYSAGKVNTIQKREKLNKVRTQGYKGNGGAYHIYEISPFSNTNEDTRPLELIQFQNGPREEEDSITGVLDTDLLEIVRHRLQCFQEGDYAVRENEIALQHIEEALLWLNKRVEDRIEKDILGTNIVNGKEIESMKKNLETAILNERSQMIIVGDGSRTIGKTHTIISLAVRYGLPILVDGFPVHALYTRIRDYIREFGSKEDVVKSVNDITLYNGEISLVGRSGTVLIDQPKTLQENIVLGKYSNVNFVGFLSV